MTQTSGLVPAQPAVSGLLKTFQGVTLWQKISKTPAVLVEPA